MPTGPQRRDAIERRKAILVAAEIAFAEKGLDVPLDEICVAAGVGRATLYRNFENRIALVHALMSANVDKLDALAAGLVGRAEGLRVYLAEILDQLVKTGGLVYLIARDAQLDLALSNRVNAHIENLLNVARSAGAVRADATTPMVNIVIRMMWGGLDGLDFAGRRSAGPDVFQLSLAALGMTGAPSPTKAT